MPSPSTGLLSCLTGHPRLGNRLGEQAPGAVFGATRSVVFEALIRLATCGSRRCCHVVEPGRPGMPPALPTSMNRFTNLLADGEFEAAARQMISHIDTVEAGLTRQIGKDPLIDLRIALLRPLIPERPDP